MPLGDLTNTHGYATAVNQSTHAWKEEEIQRRIHVDKGASVEKTRILML